MIKRRPTDLSDEERERIAPLLRKPASGTLAEH
ncbi:transposase [Mesorhizobium sp. B283B1A]